MCRSYWSVLCFMLFNFLIYWRRMSFFLYYQSEVKSICGGHQLRAVLGKYSDSNWCNRTKPKIGKDGAAAGEMKMDPDFFA